jgi:hypothetical protein
VDLEYILFMENSVTELDFDESLTKEVFNSVLDQRHFKNLVDIWSHLCTHLQHLLY